MENDNTKDIKAGIPDLERRFITTELRIKKDDGEDEKEKGEFIEGYAAVFDTWTEIWPGFRERIAKGAFKEAIKNDDVRCLINHDFNFPLGRTSAGNLKLKEDDTGLWMRCKPTDTTYARDLKVNVDAGVISQQSFAFRTLDDEWSERMEDGKHVYERTLLRVQLYDVSPVTFPAYEDTTVALRSLEMKRKETEARNETNQPPVETVASETANDGENRNEETELELRIRETKLRHKTK